MLVHTAVQEAQSISCLVSNFFLILTNSSALNSNKRPLRYVISKSYVRQVATRGYLNFYLHMRSHRMKKDTDLKPSTHPPTDHIIKGFLLFRKKVNIWVACNKKPPYNGDSSYISKKLNICFIIMNHLPQFFNLIRYIKI